MTNTIKNIGFQIRVEVEHAERQVSRNDIDCALYHLERARKQLEEMQREVWLLEHRSGEVK